MENPRYFLEKLTLPLDSQTQCFLFNVQLLWSYDCRKWVILTKNCTSYTMKILNSGARVEVGNFWTKVPKGTHLRQMWSNNSFGVCSSSGVLILYGAKK